MDLPGVLSGCGGLEAITNTEQDGILPSGPGPACRGEESQAGILPERTLAPAVQPLDKNNKTLGELSKTGRMSPGRTADSPSNSQAGGSVRSLISPPGAGGAGRGR